MGKKKSKLLGQILLSKGKITSDQLEHALHEQMATNELLGKTLLNLNYITEADLFEALAEQMGMDFVNLREVSIEPEAVRSVPAKVALHYKVVPIQKKDETLVLAMSDPLSLHIYEELELALKRPIQFVLAVPGDIEKTLKKSYGIGADTLENIMEKETEEKEKRGSREEDASLEFVEVGHADNIDEIVQEPTIIKFVNQIISEAIADRATDVHIEPFEDELRIRYRIDGLLYPANIPQTITKFQSAIITRVKIMAGMDIAERRLPQDGRIKLFKGKDEYDLRVSTLPTPEGENVSLRILHKSGSFIELEKLGLDRQNFHLLRYLIEKPHGIILVSGPTGSGKSTTLYAALKEINSIDKKIITIEDPIEYRLPGIIQIQISSKIGLTFASSLRSILRNDPDIIMVGEIRDLETSEISIRTALTGHLVFSTIHTNNASGAVTRLIDMGIEPYLVSSSVEGMIAQRLVRCICPRCKAPTDPDPAVLKRLKIPEKEMKDVVLYRGKGCEGCKYTGYKGRIAIFEIIVLNETLRRLVVEQHPASVIQQEALKMGMKPLRIDGWEKVKRGITTLDEVFRVTQDEYTEIEDII